MLVDVEVDVREDEVLVATDELVDEGLLDEVVATLDELSPLLPA